MQRRREYRYEVWESVVIFPLNRSGNNCWAGTIIDVSKSGYRVLVGSQLSPGDEVLTTLHSVAILGVVRHCEEARNQAFTIGVEIIKVVPSSGPLPDQAGYSESLCLPQKTPAHT